MTTLKLSSASGSEIGNRYPANFDVMHLDPEPLLAVVADGMGDSEGSALAGRTAVGTFVEWVDAADGKVSPEVLRAAMAAAQQRVGDIGRRVGGLAGCTLTALVESESGYWITQIGDSRVYRLREGLLELLTTDHTMAWLGVVHGWYPMDSPQAAAARYHLTRYVGHGAHPEPDVLSVGVRPEDRFLLCSDGIADQVDYHQILDVLKQRSSPDMMVRQLLAAADAAGGNDNATAIVIHVHS
ncbi:PP2C family serine/threonine-protein phosphatase [Nocardia sp. CS682]|uniref:PP2C family protein-serine/threonine phosphatase n=1 Tax=Nocardia sp. CS682 TaxID=1047172 RepID=UPI001075118B|nr:protein phosphatase 2C domain-containing protein [Nocardia sp. CS682]QBS44783.1 protein phosphatase [Nocardia sp. CS682]